MPGTRWGVGANLNFAENLLRRRDEALAIIARDERGLRTEMTYADLFKRVGVVAHQLRLQGVTRGDRVAGVVANIPEAIIAMLATTSLGAIWSSCSPDFGTQAIIERFAQIEPTVLIAVDGYTYNGKKISILPTIRDARRALPSVRHTFVVPFLESTPTLSAEEQLLATDNHSAPPLTFTQVPFDHPLYIMFSSGTTGKPKCIVHSVGGTLLEHLKELQLHTDLTPRDRIFYQTTCGWMMWNWLVSSLAVGATVVLYDGAPLHGDGRALWRMASEEGVTIFGTNAKYLAEIEKRQIAPRRELALPNLRTILSTGSVLAPESFDYVYRDVASDVQMSSISGGTDIIGCFALGNPLLPVYRSELQSISLGYDVQVFSEEGTSVTDTRGELVCCRPFPSMPTGFWNDSDGSKFRATYFERFPGVWHHGDYVELSSHTRGLVFYGRSDATLKPGGVRIGTADIYQVVESFPEILEAVAIGQRWNNDERIILFVRLREGYSLSTDLTDRLRREIRLRLSPHHVPKKILAVHDIPRTRSGKITELAIREVVHGGSPKNVSALANPEALAHFQRPELNVD